MAEVDPTGTAPQHAAAPPAPAADRDARGPALGGGTVLRSLSEDELLARILPLFPGSADLVVAPGDDAAVIVTGGRTVATTDTVVLGRDWVDAWSSGADVGHKVVAQNLADVAAMGARPTGVLLTLVCDPDASLEWVLDCARGVAQACRDAGVGVLGGDLSSAPAGVVTVSVTALGHLEGEPVLRSGARPGDVVAVCGTLGRSDAGLRLLRAGRGDELPGAVATHRRPQPPLAQGPAAAAGGATAMLDLSDGLARDGARIARASGVVVELESTALAGDVADLAGVLGADVALECVVAGGEEHSLVATFPSGDLPAGWRRIGVVRAPVSGERPTVLLDGRPLLRTGWDHFRATP